MRQEVLESRKSPIDRPAARMVHENPSPPVEDGGPRETTSEQYRDENAVDFEQYSTRSTYIVPTKRGGDVAVQRSSKQDSSEFNFDNNDAKTVTTATTSDCIHPDGISADGASLSHASSLHNQEHPRQDLPVQIATNSDELDWSFLREGELYDREEQQRQLMDIFYRRMENDALMVDNNNYYNHEQAVEHGDVSRPQNTRSTDSHNIPNDRNKKEFVIVSGLSGTGKTILVEETLKRAIMERGGYFLIGKLDQLNKSKTGEEEMTLSTANYAPLGLERPYAPFVTAFSNFVDSVVMNKDVTVAEEVRACVCSKMTSREIDLMLEIFPSLARIVRPNGNINGNGARSQKTNKVNGAENQKQLARVVRIFLQSICNPETRPIVLLIDDLQWADRGTLVLLQSLLSETETDRIKGLLLVGTCRHNEVTVEDDLATMLRTLEDEENVSICQIEVSNLSRPVCGELFARVLGISSEKYGPELASSLDPLVDIAYEQTKGNAFFFLQFIRLLHDEGYLQIDTPNDDNLSTTDVSVVTSNSRNQYQQQQRLQEQPNNWQWNEEAILHNTIALTNDAVSVIAHQIK